MILRRVGYNRQICYFFSSRYLEAPVGHYIGMNFTAFNLGPAAPNCTGQDALSVFNRDRFGMSIFAE